MTTYTATIRWSRTRDGDFAKGQYSRAHEWAFDGGHVMPASASPHVVPAPWSDPAGVDPEEAFVASLSSCHMLFFLDFARRGGWTVDSYTDEAEGRTGRNASGKEAFTKIVLRPNIVFSGAKQPTQPELEALHHAAHEACFVAHCLTAEIVVEAA